VGQNPPTGALLTYYFKSAPKGPVTVEVAGAQNKLVRRYSSEEKKKAETPPEWPDLVPPEEKIPAEAGLNRFAWDLRYEGPDELLGERDAEVRNRGPMAPEGKDAVRLTAEGSSVTGARG